MILILIDSYIIINKDNDHNHENNAQNKDNKRSY